MAPIPKRTLLLYLCLAGLALVLLAGSLPQLEFRPGLPIPGGSPEGEAGSVGPSQGVIPGIGWLPSLLQGVLAAGFWSILGYLAFRMVRQVRVRRLALLAGLAVGILVLLLFLPPYLPSLPPAGGEEMPAEEPVPSFEYATSPLGIPPPWLVGLVIGGLGVAGVALVVWIARQRTDSTANPDLVVQAADTALQDLHSGMDLDNVILVCYARMCRALQAQQGIERGSAMTAQEFERYLAQRGVPQAPVHQLTRLFESVRYGHISAQAGAEREAVDCLTAIRDYCSRKSGDRDAA